jgi:dynein heavy chain, axonemal
VTDVHVNCVLRVCLCVFAILNSAIIDALPPTPSKFHYIFNLRDLSGIFNGLVLTTPDRFQTAAQLTRVWRNECLRVLYDRLIDAKDRKFIDVSKYLQ